MNIRSGIPIDKSKYEAPEGLDRSLAALEERLTSLQPQLAQAASRAMQLFDDVYPQAPLLTDAPDFSDVYKTESWNICPVEQVPMVRELTVVIGAAQWVRIFKTTESMQKDYPRERVWFWRPEGQLTRHINIQSSHNPSRISTPYDIETRDVNDGRHVGFVGGGLYHDQEPSIVEVGAALDDARVVAEDYGLTR